MTCQTGQQSRRRLTSAALADVTVYEQSNSITVSMFRRNTVLSYPSLHLNTLLLFFYLNDLWLISMFSNCTLSNPQASSAKAQHWQSISTQLYRVITSVKFPWLISLLFGCWMILLNQDISWMWWHKRTTQLRFSSRDLMMTQWLLCKANRHMRLGQWVPSKDHIKSEVNAFSACKKYHNVWAFDSCKLGTSSLWKHIDSCRSTDAEIIDRNFPKITTQPQKQNEKEPITVLVWVSVYVVYVFNRGWQGGLLVITVTHWSGFDLEIIAGNWSGMQLCRCGWVCKDGLVQDFGPQFKSRPAGQFTVCTSTSLSPSFPVNLSLPLSNTAI